MNAAAGKGFSSGWPIVAEAFYAIVIVYGVSYSFGVFLKPMIAEFGWSRAAASGVFSLFMTMHGAFHIVMGKASDHYGSRITVGAGSLLMGLGVLLCSKLSELWQFYFFMGIIAAAGWGGYWVPLTTTVARWFMKARGLALGIVTSGVGVGTLIMSPVATYLISLYGWRMTYMLLGLMTWSTVITALLMKRSPQEAELKSRTTDITSRERRQSPSTVTSVEIERGAWTLYTAIRTKAFWMLALIAFFLDLGFMVPLVHIVAFATDIGIPEMAAGGALGLIGGSGAVGRIVMGSISDKIGARDSLLLCLTVQLATLLLLLLMKSMWMLYFFAVIFGFSYGGCIPQFPMITAKVFGFLSLGAIFGAITFTMTIGGGAGPLIAGFIFDATGTYYAAFTFAIAAYITSTILTLLGLPRSWRTSSKE